MIIDDQVLVHKEVRPLDDNLHVYPESITQFWQPILFPLSQTSFPALIESPHIVEQIELSPTAPVQVYPVSNRQPTEHPGWLPLSQISEDTR